MKRAGIIIASLLVVVWVSGIEVVVISSGGELIREITDKSPYLSVAAIGIIESMKILIPIGVFSYFFYPRYLKRTGGVDHIEKQVDEFVNKVLTNEKFHTAFSVSLPVGADDHQYGLDYIPFLLQQIENKRQRFKKYADRFLITTLCLGIFFVVLVIYFGYVLLNDSATGTARRLQEVKSELQSAKEELIRTQNLNFSQIFLQRYGFDLDSVDRVLASNKKSDLPGLQSIRFAIARFKIDNDFDQFKTKVSYSIDSLNMYQIALDNDSILFKVSSAIELYLTSVNVEVNRLSIIVNSLNGLVPELEKKVEDPKNQINEIIKRLILSIVIISFFLAILRYSARLYQNNFKLMVATENEDMAIRKFYVALKNTDKNQEDRKIVIERLLEIIKTDEASSKSTPGLSKEENGVLKELLNNLMKKL